MYGSKMRLPRGALLSYTTALEHHNSITPIRGRAYDCRPLADRRNDNLTIRKEGEAVVVRLYQTDIITYQPDGTIELVPYASVLTDDVVRQVLGRKVTPQYTHPAGPVLWVGKKGYRVPSFAVLSPDFELIAGPKPFTKFGADMALSAAVLKNSGYKTFALWLKTQIRLGLDPREGGRWSAFPSSYVVSALDNPEHYPDIARGMSAYTTIESQLARLRREVHKYHGTVTSTEVPFVTNWRELDAIRAGQVQWG